MRKTFGLFLIISFCLPLMAAQHAEFVLEQNSQEEVYQSKLMCEKILSTGSFQDCWLTLLHSNIPVSDAVIYLSGEMPQHQHGLPTTPKVIWSKKMNAYQIHGLKFSMPGKWLLNFKVSSESEDGTLKDQIILAIDVK